MNIFQVALEFYCNELDIDSSKITMYTSQELEVAGYCDRCDDRYIINILEVQEDGEAHPLSVLAHELVHVMQYEKGLLEDVGTNMCRWKGKIYLDSAMLNCNILYRASPWEQQAFALQDKLYHKFLRSGQ
jgi:hypothetical protein